MAWLVLDVLNLTFFMPFLKVDEEDIGRNIQKLKQHQWFQNYLNDEDFRKLIIHDNEIRETIGKFKTSRLNSKFYNSRCQKRVHNMLLEKVDYYK